MPVVRLYASSFRTWKEEDELVNRVIASFRDPSSKWFVSCSGCIASNGVFEIWLANACYSDMKIAERGKGERHLGYWNARRLRKEVKKLRELRGI